MRCVCCNEIMSVLELIKTKQDGTYEDMCTTCVSLSFNEFTAVDLSWNGDVFDHPEDIDDIIRISDDLFYKDE